MNASPSDRSFPIEDILARRYSPRAYSATAELTAEDLGSALEAARWSASSSNSQPWFFVIGFRGDPVFRTIAESLASGNALWAERASVLVANITQVIGDEGKERSHAVYDLGQAVAYFSAQATADGLLVHQMAGFDAEALHAALGLDDRQRVVTVMTVGRAGDIEDLPEKLQERERAPRVRKPLADMVGGSVNYA